MIGLKPRFVVIHHLPRALAQLYLFLPDSIDKKITVETD